VLDLDISGSWPEHDPDTAINRVLGLEVVTLGRLLEAIDAAAGDDQIVALQVRVGSLDVGWAKAQEVRDALARFRESGKPVHAYLEEGDDGTYYIASAADEVRMPPTATLWLDGIRAEIPFYGGTLEKVGVEADLEQIGEYKNAADVMERKTMSAEHREAVSTLVDGLFAELVAGIAESLEVSREEAEAIVASGPYTASQALEAGLIEEIAYVDEAEDRLDEAAGGSELRRIDLDDFLARHERADGEKSVGIVYCVGDIVPGESGVSAFGGEFMGADTIAEAIRAATEDDEVDALVLRVDSPGGSPTAADAIWRAATLAREESGVPLVVSMSDVAASGGYWIAMGADRVVADPATITGSIGIYGGKYVTRGLESLVGMNSVPIERGANAGINSTLQRFTDVQRARIQTQLHSVYALFLEKAAEGRGFDSVDDVDAHARGRVWTGRQALEHGLVDELGGLREAIRAASKLAHVRDGEPVSIHEYPRSPSLWEQIAESGLASTAARVAETRLARRLVDELPGEAARLLRDAPAMKQVQREGLLAYMPYRILAR
jgi:protease-4